MRITKIIERAMTPTDEGEFVVYAQVLRGVTYQYGALIYQNYESALNAKEGDNINTEEVKFDTRINGVQK